MSTLLLTEQYTDVTHQIGVQVDQDTICLSNRIEGRWNQEQQIHLAREHVEAIGHIWETLLATPHDDFYPLVDALDQEALSFEILTISRNGQTVELSHATRAGVEICTMKIAEFQLFLDWQQKEHRHE